MRKPILLGVAAAAFGLAAGHASAAPFGGVGGPWCAYYDAYTYNCGFATLAQCRETISGVGGMCRPNPYGVSEERPRRHKRARAY
jgi:hypothetical protein